MIVDAHHTTPTADRVLSVCSNNNDCNHCTQDLFDAEDTEKKVSCHTGKKREKH